jgi:hypothetical protein
MTEELNEKIYEYDEVIHYKVENEITINVRNTNETALVTYVLVIEVSDDRKKIIINREDFKVNNIEVSNKFPYISLQYMNAIFPIKLIVDKNNLKVNNEEEIIKNINTIDENLQKEYSGKGFSHIRDQFLEKTKLKNDLNNFILNLNFIKVIQLTLIENNLIDNFNWIMVPYQSVASILFKKESEGTMKYGEIQNQKELIESINKFSELNNFNVDLNFRPDYFQGEFKQEINGFESNLKFDSLETNFLVEVDNNFSYQEKIKLNNIY